MSTNNQNTINNNLSNSIDDSININDLDKSDILDIESIGIDFIIPKSIAAKIKGISKSSIQNAINRGILKEVNGVTLSSLKEYKVDKNKKISGIIGNKIKKDKYKENKDDK
jgi:hypothetical protein